MAGLSTNDTWNFGQNQTLSEMRGRRRFAVYSEPGFGWKPPINIWRDEHGRYYSDFDVAIYAPTGKTYYVDNTNGLDTNDGLTLATAFKTIKKGVDMVDAVVVMVAEGVYDRTGAFVNAAVTKSGSLAIRAIPGHKVRVVNCSPQTWAFHSQATYPHLYKSSVTGGTKVYDNKYHDANDDMLEYPQAASALECENTPGTCFISGTTTYIRTVDGRVPDSDIMVLKDQLSAQFNDGLFYIEGISFEGGNNGAVRLEKIATAPKGYFKNCKFKYATNDGGSAGGLTVVGAIETFLQNCEAARNINDGFNYHAKTGTIGNAIEVNCIGRDNGSQLDIDNGSTMHEGGKIMRFQCPVYENAGSNFGEINPGTKAWMVDCYSGKSAARGTQYNSCYTAHADAEIWLEGCVGENSNTVLLAQANAKIHLRNCFLRGKQTTEGNGTIDTY